MRIIVFVTYQDAFTRATHAMIFVIIFQSLKSITDRVILLRLGFLCSKCVIGERVQADCLWLLGIRESESRWCQDL